MGTFTKGCDVLTMKEKSKIETGNSTLMLSEKNIKTENQWNEKSFTINFRLIKCNE
jgi:hypothetical protein